MTFRLEKSTSTKTLAKFHVLNTDGDIVGSINVKPSEEKDLLAHWKSAPPSVAKNAAKQSPSRSVSAMVKAAQKHGPLSKKTILRGC